MIFECRHYKTGLIINNQSNLCVSVVNSQWLFLCRKHTSNGWMYDFNSTKHACINANISVKYYSIRTISYNIFYRFRAEEPILLRLKRFTAPQNTAFFYIRTCNSINHYAINSMYNINILWQSYLHWNNSYKINNIIIIIMIYLTCFYIHN